MISDSETSIVIECTKTGLEIYDNPVKVMTNAPAFDIHLKNLQNFNATYPSRIPGDWSSESRFLRASHVNRHSSHPACECERVSQFFHILGSVEQPKGCNRKSRDICKYTIYSSCCNTSKGIYYYTNTTIYCN